MKKLLSITITLVLLYSCALSSVSASSPTPAKSASVSATSSAAVGEKLNEQINQLKERIASRVAELNLVEKRGIIGTVKETTGNQITITDLAGKTRFVDVDEITKFSSPNSKNFGLSDLTKGTKISILGLYNKQSQRILARFIGVFVVPAYISGRISGIDDKNYTLTIISEDQKETKIDIETGITISAYTKEDGMSKYGFSKFEIGDKITAAGFPDNKDPKLLVASRVLVLPQLPQNPKIIIQAPARATTPSQ
jgi:TolA-binding protein